MSDRWMVVAAASAWAGALVARPAPLLVVVALASLVPAVRHPAPACIVLAIATSVLGARSIAGLDAPPDERFVGLVTLATDPEPTVDGRLRFEAATPHGRLLAETSAPSAIAVLSPALAGERARVTGRTTSFVRRTEWTTSRHLAGRLVVESVEATGAAAPPAEAANRIRRLLDRGAASLSAGRGSLLAGLVLGDDRTQPPELTSDFRAAGLTHLLAVSGQNVALVVVVAGPLLVRLRLWPRFVVAVAVVAGFALVTRFEPSVVRAAFVAGVALFARTTGRPSGGLRHLAIAVCLLLLVDPLLVHSLGFRLSVAASLGVLGISPRLAGRLPGPRWVSEALAVTAGAQAAVAPVLVPALGPMPLAALPANVLAGPLAGALMVWGVTGGAVAGVLGGGPAWLLHRPSDAGLAALEAVAAIGASLPLGRIDLRHLAVVGFAAGLLAWDRRPAWTGRAATGLAAVSLLTPLLTPAAAGPHPAGHGAVVWVDGTIAVVDVGPRADPVAVLDTLRDADVVAVGLVVLRTSRPIAVDVVSALEARFPVGAVLGPPGVDLPDLVVPPPGFRARVARVVVTVDRTGPPLRARIGWATSDDEAAAGAHRWDERAAVGSPGALGARPPPLRRHAPAGGAGTGRRARTRRWQVGRGRRHRRRARRRRRRWSAARPGRRADR